MADYTIEKIRRTDRRANRQLDALLEQEGIKRDRNLEYTAGIFDEEYRLIATGSCFANTLRCLAVDGAHQGEGLLGQIITHLTEYQYARGNTSLFLYTKCDKAKYFADLGYYEVARAEGRVVFMENHRNGFSSYLEKLKQETDVQGGSKIAIGKQDDSRIGAVVLNANPFTLGHQHLIRQAASQVDLLHVFVVSEEASLVPFLVRYRLVKEGAAQFTNLVFHQTGSYLISNATFPSYFLKDEDTVIASHARLDTAVFVRIADALGIGCRYVGEEPFSHVTAIYNQTMKEELLGAGIGLFVIPRLEKEGLAVSASHVRQLIHDQRIEQIRPLVPESTYRYFNSEEAAEVIERIRQAQRVIHD